MSLKLVLFHNVSRLEAEFYIKETDTFIHALGGDIIDFVQYGTSEELNEERNGYPILRLNEFSSYFLGMPKKYSNKISEETYQALKIKKGDVLICRTNGNPKYVGKSAVAMKDYDFAFASYLFRIRPNMSINSETLVTFLNCKNGRKEIEKYAMKGNQSNFSPAKFREIRIPLLKKELQDLIKTLYEKSFLSLGKSKLIYQQAEIILSETINIKNVTIPKQVANIKSFSESFGKSGRLDAEYYQEKYTRFENCIKNYSNGFRRLNDICTLKDSNFNPKPKEFYNYIELADVGNAGEIQNTANLQGNELPTRARRRVNTNDVIISSIEGSLSSCAIIPEELDGSLCSTGFYVISSDKINAETLLILFKSEPLQNLLKKGCSGTILTAINKDEFLNIPIPIIEEHIQLEIADLIQQSQTLRTQSKQLLEYAKQGVEIAIEQGEEQALDFLNKHGNN